MSDVSTTRNYSWDADGHQHQLKLVWVPGTEGEPYPFGREPASKRIHVDGFFIAETPVTQALWTHVVGHNPSVKSAPCRPVENLEPRLLLANDEFSGHDTQRFRRPA